MRWNRKSLLSSLKALGAQIDTIKSPEDAKKFLESKGYSHIEDPKTGEAVDIDKAWKTVHVMADAGESVQIVDPPAPAEGAAMDQPKDDEEEIGKSGQRAPITARQVQKGFTDNRPSAATMDAKSYRNLQLNKSYTLAAQQGRQFGGDKCFFADGERAEIAGAMMRLCLYGTIKTGELAEKYASMRRRDEEIVTKSGTVGFNASYGVLVVGEYLPELIVNLNEYGAARGAVGVTNMPNDSWSAPRITGEVTVYDVAEAGTITASQATLDLVSLYAKKTAALIPLSNELLNDASVSPVNIVTGSVLRGIGKWEDEAYLSGQHNRLGLLTTTAADAASTYDAANTNWGSWTIAKLQAAKAQRAGWAHRRKVAWICHPAFYEAVMKVNAYSAGGTPAETILNGISRPTWDGDAVIFSEHMPAAYNADQIVAYVGAFPDSTKFGIVSGSENMATSTELGFATDQTYFRYTQRWATTIHDAQGANSGIIAVKD